MTASHRLVIEITLRFCHQFYIAVCSESPHYKLIRYNQFAHYNVEFKDPYHFLISHIVTYIHAMRIQISLCAHQVFQRYAVRFSQ